MADSADHSKAYQDRFVADALARHRARPRPAVESAYFCRCCGERIPDERREAVPGTQDCTFCASQLDKGLKTKGGR